MPYPSEHSCRINQPSGRRTRRVNGDRKHDGKPYDVIYQQNSEGSWEDQAYRYPKETWTAEQAREHCQSHDGSFEAASEGRMGTPDLERRKSQASVSVDLLDDRKIRGYAIVFDSMSLDLGGFREKISPEAVDRTLNEALDVRALVDHDPSKIIGRLRAGTLQLKKDHRGLAVTIDPPNTTVAKDILESVNRGDVSGMSFAFQTLEDNWDWDEEPPLREVRDMRIREISIVSFPAYEQTDVAVAQRALNSHREEMRYRRSLDMLKRIQRTQAAR